MWIKHNDELLNCQHVMSIDKLASTIVVAYNFVLDDIVLINLQFEDIAQATEAMRTIEAGIKAGEKIVYL